MMDISIPRVLEKLDAYLGKNQYRAAERHLRYWLAEADALGDSRSAFAILNELIGLYRKCEMKEEGLNACERTLALVREMGIGDSAGAATAYINAATAYKSFGMPEEALPLYKQAKVIYEREVGDERLAGLYNNMAVTLADLSKPGQALELYERALLILKEQEGSEPEQAVTFLNMADLVNRESGPEAGEEKIVTYLKEAETLLDRAWDKDKSPNYAFVAEKCAPVFRYYGSFMTAKKLEERAARIRKAL